MKITLILFILLLAGLSSFSSVACCEFKVYNFTGPNDIGSCNNVVYFEVYMEHSEISYSLQVSMDGVSVYYCYNYRCNYTSGTTRYPHSYSVVINVHQNMAQDKVRKDGGGPDVYIYGQPYVQDSSKVLTEGDGLLIMLFGIFLGFLLTLGCVSIVIMAAIPDPFASWKKKHLNQLKDITKNIGASTDIVEPSEPTSVDNATV